MRILSEQLLNDEHAPQRNHVLEGVLIAAGWDQFDNINQTCLYDGENEDVLLEHRLGVNKFLPFINLKVRVSGSIIANGNDGKRMLVKKISPIWDDFEHTGSTHRNENEFAGSVAA